MSWQASDNERRREGGLRFGRVIDVDPGAARAKVTFGGESASDWLPWAALSAGVVSVWSPPRVGEQVIVASQSGDTAQGVIIGSVFSSENAARHNDGEAFRLWLGNSQITITDSAIRLEFNGSHLTLDAAGVRLNGARIDLNEV